MEKEKREKTSFCETALVTAALIFVFLAGALIGFKIYLRMLLA